MEELYNLGISENAIKSMIELNNDIKELSNNEIKEKEIILEQLGCTKSQMINIISSNSIFLSRTNEEILKLIKCLYNYGFTLLNILFDSNPYILNLEPFEIENYINKRKEHGESIEDIVDDLDSNPYLFNEF